MKTAKLRWGILGVAHINQRLLPAFAKTRHAELRAIASRSLERAQAAAASAGIPVAHGSYEALLDDPEIDAVYIPLPNTLHDEWTRRAAERGKHVLCEKPLTPTAAEAEAVVAFCKAKKVALMDGFMWPHHPRTAQIKRFLLDGGIGEVRRVSAPFTFPLPLDPANIRLRTDMAGGSLLDVGCYPIYAIRWAFGAEPARVVARARYYHGDGVDLEMNGLVVLGDGRAATFDCGFTLPYRASVEITGTEGMVTIPAMWLPPRRATWIVQREGREPQENAVEGADQIVEMLDDFSGAVLRGEAVRPTPDEAVKTLKVLDALARSAREEREVAV
jgi:D-xylose 1-dehydrogenase (NADP+, D-xylono-1,5-lactone-forming)